MKKVILVLSIFSAIFSLIAALLLVIAIVFQAPLAKLLEYNYFSGFYFPVFPALSCFSTLFFAVIALFTANSQKCGAWTEIVLLTLTHLPFASLLTNIANVLFSHYIVAWGADALLSYTAVNTLCTIPQLLSGYAAFLFVLTCSMSIVYKHMRKKLVAAAND